MKDEKTEALRTRRDADRLERKLAKMKASHVRTEDVARRLVAIEEIAGQRLEEALAAAVPALRECQTAEACEEILRAAIAPLLEQLDQLQAEPLPTLADEERRRPH